MVETFSSLLKAINTVYNGFGEIKKLISQSIQGISKCFGTFKAPCIQYTIQEHTAEATTTPFACLIKTNSATT